MMELLYVYSFIMDDVFTGKTNLYKVDGQFIPAEPI